ncbi:MAG: DUF2851 family protein [Bacteroidota bacterium]
MLKESLHIPESFLRRLWEEKFFTALPLATLDNQRIEILHCGIHNTDAGPDFLKAKLRIGGVTYVGDIEFHLQPEDWKNHRHDNDPRYNSIILHVILTDNGKKINTRTQSFRELPVLSLENFLHKIWEAFEKSNAHNTLKIIRCAGKNDGCDEKLLRQWLDKLALERMEFKIRRYAERMKSIVAKNTFAVHEPLNIYNEVEDEGRPEEIPHLHSALTKQDIRDKMLWVTVLYEGIFEALGYSKNQENFLQLAQRVSFSSLKTFFSLQKYSLEEKEQFIEYFFLAAANLIPAKTRDDDEWNYIEQSSKAWKKYSAVFPVEKMETASWQFFRLHPENFPTIRIAGGSRILARFLGNDYLKKITEILKSTSVSAKEKQKRLEEIFIVEGRGFFETRYRFGAESSKRIKTFIGKDRARDIIFNVVFPVLLLYARLFKDTALRNETLKVIAAFPSSAENTITRKMQEQLCTNTLPLASSMLQQGAIQLYKFYCTQDRCKECVIGKTIGL